MAFEKDDHDRLIRLSSDISWIKVVIGNHLKHHEKRDKKIWSVALLAMGAAFTALAGAAVMVLF